MFVSVQPAAVDQAHHQGAQDPVPGVSGQARTSRSSQQATLWVNFNQPPGTQAFFVLYVHCQSVGLSCIKKVHNIP